MGIIGFEQHINRQINDKLFVYNYDLKEKNGSNALKRFGLFVVGCWWLYAIIQGIRFLMR